MIALPTISVVGAGEIGNSSLVVANVVVMV